MTTAARQASARDVLAFWFGELSGGFADAAHRERWFAGGSEIDAEITERFAGLLVQAANGELRSWLTDPRDALAFVLVCDQFSRNIHRGSPRAFATDPLALAAALAAIESGTDRVLSLDERAFMYLPLEHSETLLHQHACVGLLTQLRDQTPAGQRHLTGGYLHQAKQHRDTIQRFGRFPHRNAALGRTTTPEEAAFIAGGDGARKTRLN